MRDMNALLKKARKEGAKIAKNHPSSGGYKLIEDDEKKDVIKMPTTRNERKVDADE